MSEEIERIGEADICPGCGKKIETPVKVDGTTYCLNCAAELIGQPAVPSEATGLELKKEPIMPGVEEPEEEESEDQETEEASEEEESEEEPDEERPTDVQPMSNDDEDAGKKERPTDVQPVSEEETVAKTLKNVVLDWFKSAIRTKKKEAKDSLVADPDSFSERWRRARLIREGHVILKTLSRDPKTGYFMLDTTLVKREDLPPAAVAVTNEKHTYCVDTIKTSQWYQENRPVIEDDHEAQFTARDAFLHMMTNKYDNAMSIRWSENKQINWKKLILPIAGACAALLLILILGSR